jgi:hypothetical protein
MGLTQSDIHKHLSLNSLAQARPYKWFVQMEPNWVTNLPWIHLNSQNPNLKKGTLSSPQHYVN